MIFKNRRGPFIVCASFSLRPPHPTPQAVFWAAPANAETRWRGSVPSWTPPAGLCQTSAASNITFDLLRDLPTPFGCRSWTPQIEEHCTHNAQNKHLQKAMGPIRWNIKDSYYFSWMLQVNGKWPCSALLKRCSVSMEIRLECSMWTHGEGWSYSWSLNISLLACVFKASQEHHYPRPPKKKQTKKQQM